MSNKGRVRLLAELSSNADVNFGSSHHNEYRGLPDAALDVFDAAAKKIAAHLVKTDGPFAVTLQSVITKNDGSVVDSGSHKFEGLSRHVLNAMNEEVLKVGHQLLTEAKKKA